MRKAQYFRNKNFLLENRVGTALQHGPDWSAAHVRRRNATMPRATPPTHDVFVRVDVGLARSYPCSSLLRKSDDPWKNFKEACTGTRSYCDTGKNIPSRESISFRVEVANLSRSPALHESASSLHINCKCHSSVEWSIIIFMILA